MEFSASSKSREIDRPEGFYRIMSIIFGAAFDATSQLFLSVLVLLRSKQCFGFAQANQMTGNHMSSSGCGPDWAIYLINVGIKRLIIRPEDD